MSHQHQHPGPPRRQSSSIDRLLGPSSPRPSAARLAYLPTHRVSAPRSVDVPISRVELAQCKNNTNNPLRVSATAGPPQSQSQSQSQSQPQPQPVHGLPARPSFLPQRPGEYNSQQQQQQPHIKRGGEHESPPRKRRRSNEDVMAVAGHYNARPNVGRDMRTQSPIIGLKSFNNWIKVVLIAKFGRSERERQKPKVKVLDLGCGKGGDLQKWAKAGTDEYIGIDLAAVSVEQARERWETLRGPSFQADFFAMDCFTSSIADVFEPAHTVRPFDVTSLQFCMHYAFESEDKVRVMLDNVSRFLRPGGTFMGTIPDSANLLQRLADLPPEGPLEFGNSVYRVKFDSQDATPRYGHRYTFYLEDAVEEVPEYVVYWDEFAALALEYDLHCTFCADFQQIFSEERQDTHFAELLSRMKVVDAQGDTEMNMDQWEAANLYLGFAFVKGDPGAAVEEPQGLHGGLSYD